MDDFEYTAAPARVVFGAGSLRRLPAELARLNVTRPLLLTGPRQAALAARVRDTVLAGHPQRASARMFTDAAMHTPVAVTERAMEVLRPAGECGEGADGLVSVGGGSAIGLGKALSVRTGLPHIAVPTTYAGSEMTAHLGETEGGRKVTRKDPRIVPAAVIYDVDLTMELPVEMSVRSGVNAMAHAIEAIYAQSPNPITTTHALNGIRSLARALPTLLTDPASPSARNDVQYGAFLCSLCLGSVGTALHHKLCHVLSGSFDLPHAETHAVVLPHALAYNLRALASDARAGLVRALGGQGEADPVDAEDASDLVRRLDALLARLGIKEKGLRAYRLKEEDLDKAADLVAEGGFYNPRPVERELVREVLRRAWAGEEARADL